jgi:hypothetical protein
MPSSLIFPAFFLTWNGKVWDQDKHDPAALLYM